MKTNIEIPRDVKKRTMKKVIRFPSKECTDHTGATYPSIKEMCARWSIQPETYEMASNLYPEDFFLLLGVEKIDPADLNMTPSLLKKDRTA